MFQSAERHRLGRDLEHFQHIEPVWNEGNAGKGFWFKRGTRELIIYGATEPERRRVTIGGA